MDLVISLDGTTEKTVLVYRALRAAIMDGRLPAGHRLPPTRALAADLGVARGSVATAYERLAAEGHLVARVGAGTYVAAVPATPPAAGDRPPIRCARAPSGRWCRGPPTARRRATTSGPGCRTPGSSRSTRGGVWSPPSCGPGPTTRGCTRNRPATRPCAPPSPATSATPVASPRSPTR